MGEIGKNEFDNDSVGQGSNEFNGSIDENRA